MLIESINNEKIKEIRKLKEKKYRDKYKKYIIEGEHLVNEAYKSGNLLKLIIEKNEDFSLDVDTIETTKEVIKSISSLETPYSILGICKYSEEKKFGNKILLLDNVQDPGNLGTIIRSAVAFNIDSIVLNTKSADLYNSKVIRACQGMNYYINIVRKDLKDLMPYLKENNYKIYGTNVNDGENVKNIEKSEKYAIIMGNEGSGVDSSLQKLCDYNLYIKMNEKCESLNVAVATSIILYELSK